MKRREKREKRARRDAAERLLDQSHSMDIYNILLVNTVVYWIRHSTDRVEDVALRGKRVLRGDVFACMQDTLNQFILDATKS